MTNPIPDTWPFELFALVYPHEAYEYDPEAFWEFFQGERPGVSRELMVATLRETRK